MKFEFERVLNTSLKVYSQLFVGISQRGADGRAPLAFATPYEDNAAGKKRQATVRNWNRRSAYVDGKHVDVDGEFKLLDNVPRQGFKITDDVKRVYWGGGNVVFRVEDPDGWEVEIESSNLMALIQVCGIWSGGVIPGSCMWGRDSSGKNILLHEDSQEYKTAILAAEALVKPKDLGVGGRELGSVYRLKDGQAGAYLGKVWVVPEVYSPDYDHNFRNGNLPLRGTGKFIAKMLNGEMSNLDVEMHGAGYNGDRRLLEAEQFEAIRIVSDGSERVRLYKKAYLIELIQSKLFDLTPETAADFANQHKLEWAGTRKDSPRWCFATKPVRPVYEVVKATEKQIRDTIDQVLGHQRQVHSWHRQGSRWEPALSTYIMTAQLVQNVDGQLIYGTASTSRNTVLTKEELYLFDKEGYSQHNDVIYGHPFFIINDGTGIRTISPKYTWNARDPRGRPSGYAWGHYGAPAVGKAAQVLPLLPSFSTEELLTDYLETHYNHDLFQVIVKDAS
jgi:hypothetical protein